MEYVVLATNTNHNDVVYGPFSGEDEAQAFGFEQGALDQLHQHKVLRLYSPDEAGSYVEPVAAKYDHDRGKELLLQAVQEERDAGEAPDQVDNDAAESQPPRRVVRYDSGIPITEPITDDEDEDEEEDEGDEEPETSKEDLMARAQELDIKGRSSMNKEELQAAIDAAEED
jgi:hypothetical protein